MENKMHRSEHSKMVDIYWDNCIVVRVYMILWLIVHTALFFDHSYLLIVLCFDSDSMTAQSKQDEHCYKQ